MIGLLTYLYIIPIISNSLLFLRRKIQIFEKRQEIKFLQRMEFEERIGGNLEVIATIFKYQLEKSNNNLKSLIESINNEALPKLESKYQELAMGFQRKSKTAKELVEYTDKFLTECTDILSSDYGDDQKKIKLLSNFRNNRNSSDT